ncbi:MAG: hypothetical protein AUK25_00260 [Desulfobacteraceae bacterium CG2_30_51_40]|nr:MAG: hypothetical protein AUK25_00260 [Desulfobacteraceae bacterium CG2_30_51_40]
MDGQLKRAAMKYLMNITGIISILFFCGCVMMYPTDPFSGGALNSLGAARAASLHSLRPLPQEPIALRDAIRIGLENNPDIAAAEMDENSAMAQYDLAFAERLPNIKAVGGYLHYSDDQRLVQATYNGEPGTFGSDIASADITLNLPLFTGGRIINQVNAAELLHKASGQRLARTRQELTFNISSVFFNILAQQRVVESLDFSKNVLEENLRRVKALISAKKAAKVDLLRNEVRLADIRQRLVREQNTMAVQYRILANLLGVGGEPNKPPAIQGDLLSREEVDIPECASALDKARSQRGDYLAARLLLEGLARSVDSARAGYLPTIALQGSYGERLALGSATGPTSGLDRGEELGRIGIVAEIPLFDGGRTGAKVREQLSRLGSARERLRKLELQICLEVETALLNINSSRERILGTQKAVDQAKESLRIEGLKYEAGKGSIVDVFDAERALLDSQVNYYRSHADLKTAMAQLKLVTGATL